MKSQGFTRDRCLCIWQSCAQIAPAIVVMLTFASNLIPTPAIAASLCGTRLSRVVVGGPDLLDSFLTSDYVKQNPEGALALIKNGALKFSQSHPTQPLEFNVMSHYRPVIEELASRLRKIQSIEIANSDASKYVRGKLDVLLFRIRTHLDTDKLSYLEFWKIQHDYYAVKTVGELSITRSPYYTFTMSDQYMFDKFFDSKLLIEEIKSGTGLREGFLLPVFKQVTSDEQEAALKAKGYLVFVSGKQFAPEEIRSIYGARKIPVSLMQNPVKSFDERVRQGIKALRSQQ